jgi:hypothetical protein
MGGLSLDPIRCANQRRKEKKQVEGCVLTEVEKKINPSRVSVIVKHLGLTSWIMESFGVLSLELHVSRSHVLPKCLIYLLSFPFIDLDVPFVRSQAISFISSRLE